MESMTGFGQGFFQSDSFQVVCYARSLNHRFLEIHLKLPKRYTSLEERIRSELSSQFNRGRIELQIKYYGFAPGFKEIYLDLELAKKLKTALEILQAELNFEETLSFQDFLYFRDYLTLEEKEEDVETLWQEIKDALEQALRNLRESRLKEGAKLQERMLIYHKGLKTKVDEIGQLKERVLMENLERIKGRISKCFSKLASEGLDEGRLYQEVAILLDRMDISEELDRLKVHLIHFEEAMKEECCGKKLDFLLQEMNREITTLSNKAQSAQISLLAVEVKDLIEKLREQVQNLV